MKTINHLVQEGARLLQSYQIASPYLDSEIIMTHVLKESRSFLILYHTSLVTQKQELLFWKLIKKRSERYPISQLIGQREFWSKNFIVNEYVFDPRPDSETIITTVLRYYLYRDQIFKIADFGTGTGCLLISLLSEYHNAYGIGFETNLHAYRIAYQNILQHNLLKRCKVLPISWTECHGLFDLIISNPPYIKSSKLQNLQSEVQKEPKSALDGGIDGLSCYFSIFPIIKVCLKKNGLAILEIGEDQYDIESLIPLYKLLFQEYVYDLGGRKRCIVIYNPE
ncbi:peptide chain release factor N(5)-glutamine methyltransferase [Wolbachia endosymbiont of Howardula sp.]|uniref:peptide chain release factor N(5)-glutamine methyltransferase n=1 Tax=Wolbachia endosymbiont of Howardula sp. TaxID=2916816 RepID=UPI00217DDA62|nr:peptide chain release factor N(5)-glutamine methyltransferase [Wolbachia endosymbiont of Howardula sp.]UWI82965.1 peptide chain release factor N(5)-glutamine methyltransferase [Wolbachia endosymbiont of Howardula sp.]